MLPKCDKMVMRLYHVIDIRYCRIYYSLKRSMDSYSKFTWFHYEMRKSNNIINYGVRARGGNIAIL